MCFVYIIIVVVVAFNRRNEMKISNSFIYSRQEIIWERERDRKFLKQERNDDNDDEEFFFVWYFVVVIFKKLGLFNYFLSLLLFIRNLCFFFFSSKSRRSSRFDFSPGNSLFCILSLSLYSSIYLATYKHRLNIKPFSLLRFRF